MRFIIVPQLFVTHLPTADFCDREGFLSDQSRIHYYLQGTKRSIRKVWPWGHWLSCLGMAMTDYYLDMLSSEAVLRLACHFHTPVVTGACPGRERIKTLTPPIHVHAFIIIHTDHVIFLPL